MSSSTLAAGLRHLLGKLGTHQQQDESDEQLLHTFTAHRDDRAFAELVRRHGPMVLQVCRRVLGHEQDAEDAFQATFLVLARKAAALRSKTTLAGFLHGTAYLAALKAKQAAARRRKYEGQAPAHPSIAAADELCWREIRALLDEEIARLPEKFRSVFVLCCLEDLSRAEAARRLGLKERTVLSRLAAARKRLGRRLARRGVELTAVLTVLALAQQSASALPAGLMATTVKVALATAAGEVLISASVAQLAKSATAAMVVSKVRIATVMVLAVALLGGAGVWLGTQPQAALGERRGVSPPVAASTGGLTPRRSPESVKTVEIQGRVLDPDGKPVKGARLYWPRVPKKNPKSEEDIEFSERAQTGDDGRFRFELPRSDILSDILSDGHFVLVAAADGYGVDAVELPKGDSPAEVTLRLVKDHPIEGRIVSTEGKPLAGVRVHVLEISKPRQARLDGSLTAWQQEWGLAFRQMSQHMFLPLGEKSSQAVTGRDGRFRIAGAGAERLVQLRVRGPGIAHASLEIINRADFDPATVNKTALDRAHVELGNTRPPLLYGPKFTYIAPAGRRIEGTVREAVTGKPVAGYVVYCCDSVCDGAISDKDGRYKLEGVPKRKQYLLNVEPPAGNSWLPNGARPGDEEGLRPLHVDFTVARGILVRGRVLDRTTGTGVRGDVRFVPLPGNKFAGKPGFNRHQIGILGTRTEADGGFQLAVIPGPGVLMFQSYGGEKANSGQELNPYRQAEFDAKDRERVQVTEHGEDCYFTAVDNTVKFLNSLNAVKYLDLAPDAGTAKCDLFVERGATQTIKIEDADGKPLIGTMVAGVTAKYPTVYTIKDAACTIFALDPKKPRLLLFFYTKRNLARSLTLRGDEQGPLTVRLVPVGTVTGRLLDHDGQPIAAAYVDLNTPEGTYGTARELYRRLHQRRLPIRTDKNGCFRLEGIVPEVKFTLSFHQGRTFLVAEPGIGARQVKEGETLDLGTVRVKPAQ